MSARGALLLNWLDLDPEAEPEFDLWHNREHVAERLALPGFLRCRRYISDDARPAPGQEMLILYEGRDAGAFGSPDYAASLNAPTPRTNAVVPRLRRVTRAILEIEHSWRVGLGGWMATATLPSTRGFADWPLAPEALLGVPSITGVTLARRPRAASDAKAGSAEERVTEIDGADIDACVLLEASRPDGLRAALENPAWAALRQPLRFHGFRLVFTAGA